MQIPATSPCSSAHVFNLLVAQRHTKQRLLQHKSLATHLPVHHLSMSQNKCRWIYQCECIAIKITFREEWIRSLLNLSKVLTSCCVRSCQEDQEASPVSASGKKRGVLLKLLARVRRRQSLTFMRSSVNVAAYFLP